MYYSSGILFFNSFLIFDINSIMGAPNFCNSFFALIKSIKSITTLSYSPISNRFVIETINNGKITAPYTAIKNTIIHDNVVLTYISPYPIVVIVINTFHTVLK